MTKVNAKSRWALILAGGDGKRLWPLTHRIANDGRPKQFCRLLGSETLLEQTVRRVARLVSSEQIVTVVVRQHQRFYAPLLDDVLAQHVVVQPDNRGTAPAVLYGLLRLRAMASVGPVVILPSDHYVSDDEAFMAHVEHAFEAVEVRPDLMVLIGIVPDGVETGYGWIEPGEHMTGPWSAELYPVRHFFEKPSRGLAKRLLARGGLWNSFVTIAYPSALLAVMTMAVPGLVDGFASVRSKLSTPWEDESVRRLYSQLPSTDFCGRVLATCPTQLAVLPLKGVEWTDLGEPHRVIATLARLRERAEWAADVDAHVAHPG